MSTNTPQLASSSKVTPSNILAGLVIVAVVIGLIIVMEDVWPLGADYYHSYRPAAEKLLNGETRLYDENMRGFYNAPWLVLFFIPLTWIPVQTGQAIWTVATIMILIASTHLLKGENRLPAYVWLFALFNLHIFDVLIRGQIDMLPLLGIALSWWAIPRQRPFVLGFGLWLMAIKPINVALAAILFLLTIRSWPVRDQIKAWSVTVISFLASFLFIGLDWPIRYVDNYQASPTDKAYLTLTLWRIARGNGLPQWPIMLLAIVCIGLFLWLVWRKGLTESTLALAVTTNFTFAQYATGNHYVNLIPAVLYVATRDWRIGLAAYLATWTPLLRAQFGTSVAPVDIGYTLILFAAAWYFESRKRTEHNEPSEPESMPV